MGPRQDQVRDKAESRERLVLDMSEVIEKAESREGQVRDKDESIEKQVLDKAESGEG